MKQFRFHRWLVAFLLGIQLVLIGGLVPLAYAATDNTGPGLSFDSTGLNQDITTKPLGSAVVDIVNYFMGFLGLVAVVFIIYAGVLMVVSAGNEEAVTKGRKIITYAAIGFVVIILSYSIVRFLAGAAPRGPGAAGGHCPENDPNATLTCKPGIETCAQSTGGIWECVPSTTPAGGGCASDADCTSPGQICGTDNVCKDDPNQVKTSDSAVAAVKAALDALQAEFDALKNSLADMNKDIATLPANDQDQIKGIINGSTPLEDKIEKLKTLRDDPASSPALATVADKVIAALEHLKSMREDLDKVRSDMPETKVILAAYDKASGSLDKLIAKPTDANLLSRFDTDDRALNDLITKFPMVQARIRALPGEGNAPFTVQLDGLNSFDPTGGTITDYRWSTTDAGGNEVSLGNQPVIMHEFADANTYAISLRVSTSQKDSDGYKTAMDGISVLRIRVNPPSSKVQFRINGKDANDIFHVTSLEAQSGLSFDPSSTTPALGRIINKYEWAFGDSAGEARLAPTTVVHSYGKAGDYFVKLEVTDNLGIKDKRIVKLLVKSLAADIRIAPSTGNVNTEFTFAGERSRSDDGYIKDFAWDIQDKDGHSVATSQEQNFTHLFDRPGTYTVNLVVTDITGAKDKLTSELKIVSRPPVATFNVDIPQQNHPARAEFNAIDSYDPDPGDTLTYSWDFNGDKTFEVTGSKDSVATYEFKRKGEYKAVLQVEDGFGLRATMEKKVTIDSVLAADIGIDRKTARVGDEVTFKAENSNAVAYLWEFGDGETVSTDKDTVTHTYTKSGKFMVKLNFFDNEDQENSDTQRILVGSGDKPMAVIGFTVNGREPATVDNLCGKDKPGVQVTRADVVRFDAKSSMNIDGSSRMLGYDWKFPNGERITTRENNYKFTDVSREGECFTVNLVARDQVSGKISDEDKVSFKVVNQLPTIVDFVIVPPATDNLVTPVKVILRAINPKDLDGTIKKYKWYYYREGFENERLGLHNTATPETEMVITSNGEPDVLNKYFFALIVVDNDNGEYSTVERFGEVSFLEIKNGPNLSPVAEFTMDKSTVTVGDSISLVSTSYDPQGDTMPNDAYRWDFDGDGTFDDTTSGPTVNRQFNTPGEYDVRLKVIYRGLSSSASHKVVVEAANALPQAAFTYQIDGTKVLFDASSTRYDPSLKDPTLRFEWDFNTAEDSNGNGINDDDVQSTEMKPSYSYNEKGIYRVRLKVKDSLGMEGVVVREIDLNQTEEERQKNAFKSLKITAPKSPITTLDIELVPSILEKGGSSDVNVTVLNADNSIYTGKVYFEILEGSGIFSPNPVDAKDSKAASVFNATESGKVRVKIRATDTLYGELTEEATLNVK
jgi:PKD repeat protein